MSELLVRSLREAALTLLAMLATLACTQWLEPGAANERPGADRGGVGGVAAGAGTRDGCFLINRLRPC